LPKQNHGTVCAYSVMEQLTKWYQHLNGGSNYDSFKGAKCLVIYFVKRMNGLTRLEKTAGKKTLMKSLNLVRLCEMT
jgi:hypothetical protein